MSLNYETLTEEKIEVIQEIWRSAPAPKRLDAVAATYGNPLSEYTPTESIVSLISKGFLVTESDKGRNAHYSDFGRYSLANNFDKDKFELICLNQINPVATCVATCVREDLVSVWDIDEVTDELFSKESDFRGAERLVVSLHPSYLSASGVSATVESPAGDSSDIVGGSSIVGLNNVGSVEEALRELGYEIEYDL